MKRILVFSDTHNDIKNCINVIKTIPCDLVIHLGDLVRDVKSLEKIFPQIDFKYIAGNNDFYSNAPKSLVVEFDGYKFFCNHGHMINEYTLIQQAKENNCTYLLVGHTHISMLDKSDGITIINPGSISRPRDGYYSYCVIEIEENKINQCIIRL